MTWAFEVAARTLLQEARGEPLLGKQAVCWVLRNRLASKRWGYSLATVCLWPHQFSGWANAKDPNFSYACSIADDDLVLQEMRDVLSSVLALDSSTDPTQGATHYANLALCNPEWIEGAIHCGKFGQQDFFRGVK